MILLIAGSSHTGKTLAAQRVLERYAFPYLSIDHLKMGLIRSGICPLTPESPDEELTPYLWNIVREIIKTAVENGQNLVVEGCYLPFDWKKDFEKAYLEQIRFLCLIFSESYIQNHYGDIVRHADAIERRGGGFALYKGASPAGKPGQPREMQAARLRFSFDRPAIPRGNQVMTAHELQTRCAGASQKRPRGGQR